MRNGPRSAMGDTPNSYCRDMTEALEADPPVITWRKGKGGVRVPVEVIDPHTTKAKRAPKEEPKPERKPPTEAERRAAVEQWELARLRVVESMQDEADEVAERFRKHRADNTSLMDAARRDI